MTTRADCHEIDVELTFQPTPGDDRAAKASRETHRATIDAEVFHDGSDWRLWRTVQFDLIVCGRTLPVPRGERSEMWRYLMQGPDRGRLIDRLKRRAA